MHGEKTVVILGAGASAHFASQDGRYPLQKGFFANLFNGRGFFDPGSVYHLELYLRVHHGGPDLRPLQDEALSVEDLLREIDQLSEAEAGKLIAGQEYTKDGFFPPGGKPVPHPGEFLRGLRADVQRVVGYVIRLPNVHGTVGCKVHDRLVSSLEPGDTVVSFNYDPLIDTALQASGRWHPATGYGLHVRGILTETEDPFLTRLPPPDSQVVLLKPHGSMNWGIPMRSVGIQPPPLAMCPHVGSGMHYQCDCTGEELSTHIYVYGRFQVGAPDPGAFLLQDGTPEGIYLTPGFFMPPFPKKSMGGGIFGRLWVQVLESVTQAQHVLIIGYSLPTADSHVSVQFRRLTAGCSPKKVSLVSPASSDPDFVRRFAEAFSLEVGVIARPADTFEAFVAGL